jgi:azurin
LDPVNVVRQKTLLKHMKNSIKILSFLLAAATLASCGNAEKTTTPIADSSTVSSADTAIVSEAPVTETVLNLEANDQMKYNLTELKATAGQPIKLTLKHTGKFPITAMGHNVVILKQGTDVDAFAAKALEAKDNQYIPKSEEGSIVAHTKLLGGGEEDTITFTVAEKGTYTFICSFPGHYTLMKGTLVVE